MLYQEHRYMQLMMTRVEILDWRNQILTIAHARLLIGLSSNSKKVLHHNKSARLYMGLYIVGLYLLAGPLPIC